MSKVFSIIFLLASVSLSCQEPNNIKSTTNATADSRPIATSFVPTDSNQLYFPLEVFKDTSRYVGRDTFVDIWYSQHLFAMHEPVFYRDQSDNEIYRFTWLRSFHHPIAIRIERHNDAYRLYWKMCNGAGGYKPGELVINKQREINKATWTKFQDRLSQIDFWNLKTSENTLGTDGSQWILEGKTSKQYHVVDRWTPDEKSKYYQCCNFLIGLTNLKVKRNDKY